MPNVSIVVPGTNNGDKFTQVKDLDVEPGARVADALRAAGLAGYTLRTEAGQRLAEGDDVSKLAGAKLYATPEVKVGA